MEKKFKLKSNYEPKGDQPKAIEDIMEALNRGDKFITLLGATGTGKTFSISNVIERYQRPTLIMAPNKTLAAQLYQEFKDFFPDNAVEYYISYYDYYQPEAYLPAKGQYIEKDLDINTQIQRYRLSTLKSLITRKDVIVIASVSCIFGSENPESRRKNFFYVKNGDAISVRELSQKLINIQYERNDIDIKPGLFKAKGDTVTIYPAEFVEFAHKIMFFGDEIEEIYDINPVSGEILRKRDEIALFPALEFITDRTDFVNIMEEIRSDLDKEVQAFKDEKRYAEAQRLEQRVNFDLEMIQEMGSVKGIENYSRYFDRRKPGEPSYTIMDYFPEDFLLIMDESHLGVPQIHGMIGGDVSRKKNLIDYGFRLKAAYDNRPLRFEEWEKKIHQVIFTSATPGEYEIEHSNTIADQVIRPTGLLDPIVEVRNTKDQIENLLNEIKTVIARNERVLITTLTKKLAENIAEYYEGRGLKITYLHSDIDTLERSEILRDLRTGKVDVLIGINLLREGLDLPEVSLVGIFDADKEGFLRNTRSLIQTIGRASRNSKGLVILYADTITESIRAALKETNRRRKKQIAYNKLHGITPETIHKNIAESLSFEIAEDEEKEIGFRRSVKERIDQTADKMTLIENLEAMMHDAAEVLDFERAAFLRDKIRELTPKKK